MATRTKITRLEAELEKYRSASDWGKTLDIARQIHSKSPQLENLVNFVHGESHLERYMLEHPPTEDNIPLAQKDLDETRTKLTNVLSSDPNTPYKIEIILLTAKIAYAMGNYIDALKKFDEVDLDHLNLDVNNKRRLKIVGEAYAIKGLCLEKAPKTALSKYKASEKDELIMKCFEKSGDLSLIPMYEEDKGRMGSMVETAIQRSPMCYIRNGDLSRGIGRFRELLRVVETRATQSLRQTLARQLAEVLLRGVCENNYEPPFAITTERNSPARGLKPRKYTGDNLFLPENQNDETLLLLLISESMATREAVLDRSPEHKEARLHTFHNTTAVYDLLTLALVKRMQYTMLSETFERAMKFSYDQFHIWHQFALSLICAEKYTRALLVLKECMRLDKNHIPVRLQAAKIAFEHLNLIDEGISFAKEATDNCEHKPLASKAYLTLGLGYSLKAESSKLQVTRQENQKLALNCYFKAVAMDSNDHLSHFHVALHLAILRQTTEAMKYARKALTLRTDHLPSLHLLVLLLSSQKKYEEALQLTEAAINEYPNHFGLWFTRCRLEEVVFGVEDALQTCKQMLAMWKEIYEPSTESQSRTGAGNCVTPEHKSIVQIHLGDLSDRDSGSMRAESIAASRIEHTLSEVASSLNYGNAPRQGPNQMWNIQVQIWLLLAELYLAIGKLEEVNSCIHEAADIFPVSFMVMCMKGQLFDHNGQLLEAKAAFENAIAINPIHVKSLQHLGIVLHKMGNDRLAEKVLRDAVNADPTSYRSWKELGIVLQSLEEFDAAAECLMTSVDLETTSPIVPFTTISRSLKS